MHWSRTSRRKILRSTICNTVTKFGSHSRGVSTLEYAMRLMTTQLYGDDPCRIRQALIRKKRSCFASLLRPRRLVVQPNHGLVALKRTSHLPQSRQSRVPLGPRQSSVEFVRGNHAASTFDIVSPPFWFPVYRLKIFAIDAYTSCYGPQWA